MLCHTHSGARAVAACPRCLRLLCRDCARLRGSNGECEQCLTGVSGSITSVAAHKAAPALASAEEPSPSERKTSPAHAPDVTGAQAVHLPATLPRPLLRRLGMFSAVAMLSIVLLNPGSGLSNDHGAAHFTIRVSGTPSQRFIGAYTIVAADGSEKSHVVEGTVPAEFSVSAASLSATLQRLSVAGSLTVEIVRDRRVISHSETSAADGLVVATTR